jgi:hypothetical protein
MLFRVSDIKHDRAAGSHARRIELVDDPIMLPDRDPIWRTATEIAQRGMYQIRPSGSLRAAPGVERHPDVRSRRGAAGRRGRGPRPADHRTVRELLGTPGLRMFKGEDIDDVIARIAEDELGVPVDVDRKRFLGQYVGRFKTEHERQDLSSGYVVQALSDDLRINAAHFSSHRVIKKQDEVPTSTGAMYRFYLSKYFDEQ